MSNQDVSVSEITMTEKHTKVKYSFEERREGITKTCFANVKIDFQPAEDLRNAIKDLKPHVAILMNYDSEDELVNLSDVSENSAIVPTGIKFFQKPNSNLVQIVGFIHSKRKQIPFVTPKIDLMDSQYRFLLDLEEVVEEILDESTAYVNGKFDKVRTQLSLTDDTDEGSEEKEATMQVAA